MIVAALVAANLLRLGRRAGVGGHPSRRQPSAFAESFGEERKILCAFEAFRF
jgi:hypothetical protein